MVLPATAADVFEHNAIPIGIAIGMVILFATKFGRNHIDNVYSKTKGKRETTYSEAPTERKVKAPVWFYLIVAAGMVGAGFLLMRLIL